MPASFLDFRLFLLLIFILPIGFATTLLAARAWREQQRVNAARGWQSVPGKVIAASVESISLPVRVQTSTGAYRLANRYAPAIVYEYHVNGRRYYGNRLRLGSCILFSDFSGAEREAARYPIGSQVIVWYNPADLADSTLERRAGWEIWIQWLVCGLLILIILALIVFLWW